jgi:hypothetical protein
MRHQDLTINHILESWVFANAAARNATGSYVAGDVGRVSFTTDTGQYYRLTSTTPTWQLIGPVAALGASYATLQTSLANPAGSGSTSFVYMGLGVGSPPTGAKITPTATGKLFVSVTGSAYNTVADHITSVLMYYGTGTAPANQAPAPGSGIGFGGGVQSGWTAGAPANVRNAFGMSGIITGLAIGVPVWLDVGISTSSGGGAAVGFVAISAAELP